MSENQYLEFRAVDHRLSDRQMRELRAVSTRAENSPTRFANENHRGASRATRRAGWSGNLDAFLYFAGWGTRRLMLRLPSALLDLVTAARYGADDGRIAWSADGFTILGVVAHVAAGAAPQHRVRGAARRAGSPTSPGPRRSTNRGPRARGAAVTAGRAGAILPLLLLAAARLGTGPRSVLLHPVGARLSATIALTSAVPLHRGAVRWKARG